jgi:hypothetical protein
MVAVPHQIQKVAVRGLDALPVSSNRGNSSKENRKNGLEVTSSIVNAKPPWWSVGGGEQGHEKRQECLMSSIADPSVLQQEKMMNSTICHSSEVSAKA